MVHVIKVTNKRQFLILLIYYDLTRKLSIQSHNSLVTVVHNIQNLCFSDIHDYRNQDKNKTR